MKQLKKEELELIKQVYEDLQKQVLDPLKLNEAFKLINDEEAHYLHNKRAKILTINRFMQFQYEAQLKLACLDDLFMEETEVEKVVEEEDYDNLYVHDGLVWKKPMVFDENSSTFDDKEEVEDLTTDTTQTSTPQDEVTASPTKIVNKQKPKGRGRTKQTHKE